MYVSCSTAYKYSGPTIEVQRNLPDARNGVSASFYCSTRDTDSSKQIELSFGGLSIRLIGANNIPDNEWFDLVLMYHGDGPYNGHGLLAMMRRADGTVTELGLSAPHEGMLYKQGGVRMFVNYGYARANTIHCDACMYIDNVNAEWQSADANPVANAVRTQYYAPPASSASWGATATRTRPSPVLLPDVTTGSYEPVEDKIMLIPWGDDLYEGSGYPHNPFYPEFNDDGTPQEPYPEDLDPNDFINGFGRIYEGSLGMPPIIDLTGPAAMAEMKAWLDRAKAIVQTHLES
jgi:hypothetical protein